MSVQIKGDQIKSATISSAKLDLTGTYDFSSGTLQAADELASGPLSLLFNFK